jgi:hypothetical protein
MAEERILDIMGDALFVSVVDGLLLEQPNRIVISKKTVDRQSLVEVMILTRG